MSFFYVSDDDIRVATQSSQSRYVRVEILNKQFYVIEYVEGETISGNITIDANSDLRRTGSVTMAVKNSSFEIKPYGDIWIDRYLRLLVGTYDSSKEEIAWTNCGIFIIDAPNYSYDVANNTLTLSLLDLMANLTGERNGYLKGVPLSFKAGQKIKEAMIGVLDFAKVKDYQIQDPPEPGIIPFDMDFGQGTTVYQVLKALAELYPNYEMFFDIEGTFIYQPIPAGNYLPISLYGELWEKICTNESVQVDFQNVKNSIEVYGRVHNPAHFSQDTGIIQNKIRLVIPDVQEYYQDMIYGFTLSRYPETSPTLGINELPAYPILENGHPPIVEPEHPDTYYCVQYKGDHWEWIGHLQAYAIAEETNPDSPFYIKKNIGRIRLPLFGGDYENVFTDDLARERAQYELFLHSNMNDTITLTCIPAYWMDVNILTEYTPRRDKSDKGLFLIKSVNMGLAPSDVMTVTMIRNYSVEEPDVSCAVKWNVKKPSGVKWNKGQSTCRIKWNVKGE